MLSVRHGAKELLSLMTRAAGQRIEWRPGSTQCYHIGPHFLRLRGYKSVTFNTHMKMITHMTYLHCAIRVGLELNEGVQGDLKHRDLVQRHCHEVAVAAGGREGHGKQQRDGLMMGWWQHAAVSPWGVWDM